jgi:TatD DNase family protein
MTTYIDFHTHYPSEADDVFSIQNYIIGKENLPTMFHFSAGIHPWYWDEKTSAHLFSILEKDVLSPRCLAIGECGLDKLTKTPFDQQINVFLQQIKLAESLQKPLVIHCVKAFSELIALKKKHQPSVPMIIHGFNNNLPIFQELLSHNFYFSFGAALLHENSNAAKALLNVPKNRFFLETDDKNIPIQSVYQAAAALLQKDIAVLQKNILDNVFFIFPNLSIATLK